YVRLIADSLGRGEWGIDAWDNHCCLGGATLRTYQNMGHFLAGAISWALNLTRPSRALHFLWVLAFCLQCPAFYFASRNMGLSREAAVGTAWLAPLVSGGGTLGHELGSYDFMGLGIFSQCLAVPCLVLAIGSVVK